LVTLALDDLPAVEEDRLAAHLVSCAECRAAYAGVEDGLAQVLVAGPSIAPPPGFSGRVLAAMGLQDADAGPAQPAGRPRPGAQSQGRIAPRRRVALLVAASVLVGLLCGVGGTLAATSVLGRAASGPTASGVSATLLTASGDAVGEAGVTPLGGREYLAISVTRGRPGLDYECVLIDASGVRTSGGHWTLSDDYGSGQASGAWLVPLPGDRPPSRVEMIGPSGSVWSSATF
jgi:hypothetical protein